MRFLNHQPSEEENAKSQNFATQNFTDADITAIDEALAVLKQELTRSSAFSSTSGAAS
ncbi:MAG: hypothetical protein ACREXK_07755 [Gammaproteobacteria bacterium]